MITTFDMTNYADHETATGEYSVQSKRSNTVNQPLPQHDPARELALRLMTVAEAQAMQDRHFSAQVYPQ